jgi:hypothetical protein
MEKHLMLAIDQITVNDKEGSNLLDCYRIALDFGMPAALKAYEKLSHESAINSDNTAVHEKKTSV